MVKEIIYYTDNTLDNKWLGSLVKEYILKSNLPILSVSLKPIEFGKNIHYIGKRGHSNMFKQILTGLKESTAEYVFLCEHDVLYHPSHFDFVPKRDDIYYYNNNVWKYKPVTGKIIGYDCRWLSQICASREILISHYEKKMEFIEAGQRAYGFEPGTKNSKIKDYNTEWWESDHPNIDIRHGRNFTGTARMSQSEFRDKSTCRNWKEIKITDITGWGEELLAL